MSVEYVRGLRYLATDCGLGDALPPDFCERIFFPHLKIELRKNGGTSEREEHDDTAAEFNFRASVRKALETINSRFESEEELFIVSRIATESLALTGVLVPKSLVDRVIELKKKIDAKGYAKSEKEFEEIRKLARKAFEVAISQSS